MEAFIAFLHAGIRRHHRTAPIGPRPVGRTTVIWILACATLLGSPAAALAQSNGKYERKIYVTAHARHRSPVIDGRIDEECWEQVDWGGDFVQWEPHEGKPPSQQTAFKILYDDEALYFAARAFDDEPDKIESLLARRDRFPGDWVEINIDSYHDLRTAFSFTSSVSGTRGDEFVSNDGNDWDGNWDPVWELKTHVDELGWTLEARIPLSQLRFGDQEDQVWGIQVQRNLYREQERSLWQPKDKNESGWVSRFGELHGIQNISGGRKVELLPYGLTKGERYEGIADDPFNDGSSADFSLGLDGKVGVTSNITADFTLNPDFGQVEADPSEVNLTAFESFFSEKRPFFIEGSNILDFQIAPSIAGGSFTQDNLFYSRRIGRRPQHSPDLADGEYADVPVNTSILGAAKLTGKTTSGLSIGILESVTAKEKASVATPGGVHQETVEPATNFFVGRVQQDLNQANTRIGTMFTTVHRGITDSYLSFLHDEAYSGGLDFIHQWNDKTWYVAMNGAVSHVRGSADALYETQTSSRRYYQRPDNDYTTLDPERTSLTGHAGSLRLAKISGGNFRFETGAAWRSPGFEINDVGFLREADQINQFTWAGYSIRKPFSVFRSFSFNTNQWLDWDFGGTNLNRQFNGNFNAQLKNAWRFGAGLTRGLEWVSNTALRGGPSSRWPGYTSSWFWVNSDDRKRFYYGFGGNFLDADEGSHKRRNGWVYASFRPSNAVRLSMEPWFTRNRPEMQYIDTSTNGDADRFLFGRMDQKTFGLTLRLDYSITPNLTVQYYGAPFISSGEYRDFKRITDPHADQYRSRFHEFTEGEITYSEEDEVYLVDENGDGSAEYSFDRPDFNFKDFNSNLVVRWEFQAGSTLYLVWSQARSQFVGRGEFSIRHDMNDLFDVHPHNVFLIKINKWFSL